MGLAEVSDEPKEAPDVWSKQPAETEEAWLAFRAYRDMVPDERKISHAATRSTPVLSRWYRDHNWQQRVDAYDKHFDKINVDERERIYRRKAKEIAIDHMLMLANARELVKRELQKYVDASREHNMHGLVKMKELQGLFDMVVKLDRLVRDQPTEIVGSRDLDYSQLAPEELDTLQALLEKASREADPNAAPGHAKISE